MASFLSGGSVEAASVKYDLTVSHCSSMRLTQFPGKATWSAVELKFCEGQRLQTPEIL